MDGLVAQFENTCSQLNILGSKDKAERVLIDLRKSPQAIDLSRFILENGKAEEVQVQFQAAFLLKHAVIEQWSGLNMENRIRLRDELLQLLVSKADQMSRVVLMQLISLVAIMAKRLWLENSAEAAKKQLFDYVSSLLRVGNSASLQIIGLSLLENLVDEFSSTKATKIGESFSYHRECHISFQKTGLRESFILASNHLCEFVSSTVNNNNTKQSDQVIRSCLRLMESCLLWDFRRLGGTDAAKTFHSESTFMKTREHITMRLDMKINPGDDWRDILIESQLVETLFKIYMQTRQINLSNDDNNIGHLLRQLLILLASLNGDIFENDVQRTKYVDKMLSGCLFGVLAQPMVTMEAAAGLLQTYESNSIEAVGGTEYLGMCDLLSHLVSNFGVEILISLSKFDSNKFTQTIDGLLMLSKSLLQGVATCVARPISQTDDSCDDIDNSWLMEAFNHMLDIWVSFSSYIENNLNNKENQNIVTLLRFKVSELYCVYIEKRLFIARTGIERDEEQAAFPDSEQFEDQSVLDDHLISISLLGRADMVKSVSLMIQVFGMCQDKLKNALNSTSLNEWSKVSEELFWVVLLSAYLLANSGDGERPTIPNAVIQLCNNNVVNRNEDLVVKLSNCLLGMLEFESERVRESNGANERISPLLAEKLLFATTRWAQTFLIPETALYSSSFSRISGGLPPSIENAFGRNENGVCVITFLVKCATTYLSIWGTEKEVTDESIRLLDTIVENKASRELLLQMDSWQELSKALVSSVQNVDWKPLSGLTPQSQGSLLVVLIKSLQLNQGYTQQQFDRSRDIFVTLLSPLKQRLQFFAQNFIQQSKLLEEQHQSGQNNNNKGKPRIKIVTNDPQWGLDFERLIQMHIGIVKADTSGPLAKWCREMIVESLNSCWIDLATGIMIHLNRLGINDSSASFMTFILELVSTFIDVQLQLAPESELFSILKCCDKMIQIYSEYNVLLNHSRQVAFDEDSWVGDVIHLLKILTAIADRDVLDFSEEESVTNNNNNGGGEKVDAVQVVLQGVSLVFPLLTSQLLQHPELAECFFTLLTTLITTYPDKIANLNSNLFSPMMNALEIGITDHRPTVSRKSFEALFKLAEYHANEIKSNRIGLGSNLYPNGQSSPSVLLKLLQEVFSFIIFQNFDSSLLDPAANTILALIACEQNTFPTMVQQLIQQQPENEMKERLTRAFEALTRDNNVQLTFDRINRQKFQKNILHFVNEVRGFMRRM